MAYPPPAGYPGMPGVPGGPPVDPLWPYFSQVAGADGQIDAEELQRCLTASGIGGSYQPFSKETCRVMIAMLDRDYSGKMGFNEFKELWAALNQWKAAFERFDADRSGSVEPHELHTALSTFGYNLSANAQGAMVRHFATDGKIGFDSFVACCVKLRVLTTAFQQRDAMRNGTATFRYDDFIAVVMGI